MVWSWLWRTAVEFVVSFAWVDFVVLVWACFASWWLFWDCLLGLLYLWVLGVLLWFVFGDLLWFMICLMFGGILFWCLFDTLRFGLIVCGYWWVGFDSWVWLFLLVWFVPYWCELVWFALLWGVVMLVVLLFVYVVIVVFVLIGFTVVFGLIGFKGFMFDWLRWSVCCWFCLLVAMLYCCFGY